jgi:hypothetical protein
MEPASPCRRPAGSIAPKDLCREVWPQCSVPRRSRLRFASIRFASTRFDLLRLVGRLTLVPPVAPVADCAQSGCVRPAPCALRPAPCALRPAPCALRPAPFPLSVCVVLRAIRWRPNERSSNACSRAAGPFSLLLRRRPATKTYGSAVSAVLWAYPVKLRAQLACSDSVKRSITSNQAVEVIGEVVSLEWMCIKQVDDRVLPSFRTNPSTTLLPLTGPHQSGATF